MAGGFSGQKGQTIPEMNTDIVNNISERYIELYENITGEKFIRKSYSAKEMEDDIKKYLAKLK